MCFHDRECFMCIIVGEDTDRIMSDDSTCGLKILSSYGTAQLGDSSYFLYETLFQTLKNKKHSIQAHVLPRFWSMGLLENRLRQNPVVYHVPCENFCFLPINRTQFGGIWGIPQFQIHPPYHFPCGRPSFVTDESSELVPRQDRGCEISLKVPQCLLGCWNQCDVSGWMVRSVNYPAW